MKYEFKRTIGGTFFTFHGEADTMADFFKQVSPYMEIPTTGPNGEEDIRLKYRVTKVGGFAYYSAYCPESNQEFEMGQSKNEKGALFPKGWRKVQYGQHEEPEELQDDAEIDRQDAGAPASIDDRAEAELLRLIIRDKGDKSGRAYYQFLHKQPTAEQERVLAELRLKYPSQSAHTAAVAAQAPMSPSHHALNGLIIDLRRMGVAQPDIDARIARICSGVHLVEQLDNEQVAKALRSLTQYQEQVANNASQKAS